MFYVMHDVDIQQSNVTLGWGPVAVEKEKHVLHIAFILDMKVKFSIHIRIALYHNCKTKKKNIYIYIYFILSTILSHSNSHILSQFLTSHSSSLLTPSLTSLSFKACTSSGFWILEVESTWIGELGLDQWVGIG